MQLCLMLFAILLLVGLIVKKLTLMLALLPTGALFWPALEKAMMFCIKGVNGVAIIFLIIAAGGAFKHIPVEGNVGEAFKLYTGSSRLSPLILGWLIAAFFRVTPGLATAVALTASGLVSPLLANGVSPELMVLSVGTGSLFCLHVNDSGFWMFKEYFGLNFRQTVATWTVMESLISVLGRRCIQVRNAFLESRGGRCCRQRFRPCFAGDFTGWYTYFCFVK